MEVRDLSFAPGLGVQEEVFRRFGLPISSNQVLGSFALVVSFGRCKLRLSDEHVGWLLQATIGGSAAQFHVSQLAHRVFKFFVSSRQVGFFIRRLVSFACDDYKLFFHLWGNGGPNWRAEYSAFSSEDAKSWTQVTSTSNSSPVHSKSFAEVVRTPPLSGANAVPIKPISGANRVPLGDRSIIQPKKPVFDRLVFPETSHQLGVFLPLFSNLLSVPVA